MKKALCLAILLVGAAVGYAASGIDIYITAANDVGGEGQVMSNDFIPGERFGDTEDAYVQYFTAPTAGLVHSGPFQQQIGTTETYYLWADLHVDPNSVGAARVARLQIYGLDLTGCTVVPTNTIGASTEYRDMNLNSGTPVWDTVGPVPCFNGLQAVTNSGMRSEDSGNLQYVTGTGAVGKTTHALIGAFEFNAHKVGPGLYLGLGQIFAAVREYKKSGAVYSIIHDWDSVAGGDYPGFSFQGVPYARGGAQQLAIEVIPEPASMVLLALAGLLIRRR